METIEQQVQKLRDEIAMTDANMLHGVYIIVVLMIAAYVAGVITNKAELYKLVLMLAVTAPFFIARMDYMIHRAGSYIRYTEAATTLEELRQKYPAGSLNNPENREPKNSSSIESWESWKGNLKSRVTVLPVLDAFAPIAALYVIICAMMFIWPGDHRFVFISAGAFLLGIAAIPLSVQLAGK